MKTYIHGADLGNPPKKLVEEVIYNVSIGAFGKEDESLFILSKKENDPPHCASDRQDDRYGKRPTGLFSRGSRSTGRLPVFFYAGK